MKDTENPDKKTFSCEEKTFASTVPLVRDEILDASLTKLHCYLKVVTLDEGSKIIELSEDNITIGRTNECEIQLQMEGISRKHALISLHNEEYYIKDLDSKNGIFLNGVRIAKCVLRNKDQIDIAGVKIIFNEVTSLIRI